MKHENRTNLLSRNARFIWLAALFLPPLLAFVAYNLTPHEEIWHEIVFSLLCIPIFFVWVIALISCVVSFLMHRTAASH